MTHTAKNILIIGHYGVVNWGDEAILSGILECIENKKKASLFPFLIANNSNSTVVSANPSWTTKQINKKSVPHPPFGFRSFCTTPWWQFFQALWKSDTVIIGGGGLFQPNPSVAFWIWGYHLFLALCFQKPVYILGNSFESPKKESLITTFLRFLFSKISAFSVREEFSKNVLCDFWKISADKISVHSDFAYYIEHSKTCTKKQSIILFAMREGDLTHAQEKTLIQKIQTQYSHLTPKVLVMQQNKSHDEHFATRHALEAIFPSSLQEVMEYINNSELVVSSRLHANIIADLLGVPFVAIAPRQKIVAMFGKDRCILPRDLSEN